MSDVKRWHCTAGYEPEEGASGRFVLYDDHAEALATERAAREDLAVDLKFVREGYDKAEAECDQLRAERDALAARVEGLEALVERWRSFDSGPYEACADELEAAIAHAPGADNREDGK